MLCVLLLLTFIHRHHHNRHYYYYHHHHHHHYCYYHYFCQWITGQKNLIQNSQGQSSTWMTKSESPPAERHQTVYKVKVYRAVIVSTLLYRCETWTTSFWHIKQLEQFHTRALRMIMGIHWQDKAANQEVLDRTGSTSIESKLLKAQLSWTGHAIRMTDSHIPRQLL